jgi:hypothetical protein
VTMTEFGMMVKITYDLLCWRGSPGTHLQAVNLSSATSGKVQCGRLEKGLVEMKPARRSFDYEGAERSVVETVKQEMRR